MNPEASLRPNERLGHLFEENGWRVAVEPPAGHLHRADLLVKKGRHAYIVEVKAISEGRPDRAIPLLSQAILQAQAYARAMGNARPLAVIYVVDASPSLLKHLQTFSKDFASDVAVGVISENGTQSFVGEGLEALNAEPSHVHGRSKSKGRQVSDLFSDLNQWMLKVLLAPEIPPHLLSAPRAEYRNVSELASAANVSVMSAYRFVHQLREDGFVDSSSPHIQLVRREELFRRWHSAALRPSPEVSLSLLIRGSKLHTESLVRDQQACLGLFAAAEALHLGHVHGVPPYLYVRKLPRLDRGLPKGFVFAAPGERVDLILKQARAPQSVFRGAVSLDGFAVSDLLQVWLDVSSHPSRGAEQADVIYRKVMRPVVEGPSK
jgi:hypothetical protein